jgi:predicted lipoprotein with Yx(FWY)xxD motif
MESIATPHSKGKPMTLTRSLAPFGFVAVAPIAALAIAGCGGTAGASSASSSTPAPTTPATPATPAPTTGGTPASLGVASSSSLGNILVDSRGRTLYLFQKDTGTTSTCTGACAAAWPPLTVTGKPTASGNANASMVGTTTRSDGTMQVTYNGHPLYLYIGDTSAGTTAGQGVNAFGALWYVVSPSGSQITGGSSAPSSGLGY